MRQALFVIGFVSYSLLAHGQSQSSARHHESQGQEYRQIRIVTHIEAYEALEKLMREKGIFKPGSTGDNYYVPSLEDFENKYGKVDDKYRTHYSSFRENHNRGVVGTTITLHTSPKKPIAFMDEISQPLNPGEVMIKRDPKLDELVRTVSPIGMSSGIGMPMPELAFLRCAGDEQINRCPLTPENYNEISDHRSLEVLMRQQASCLNKLADEVAKTNPQCAANMKGAIVKYVLEIDGFFKPMDPKTTPKVGGGTGKTPRRSRGKS